MHVYVLVGSTIFDTSTIYKIQENANITKTTSVAQIELSEIARSICQIEQTICDTQLLFEIHGHTSRNQDRYFENSFHASLQESN